MKQQLHVLMVEDSEDDTLLLTRQLQHGGFELQSERVETASSFVSALESKEWDIILCDYKMPKFNGMNALSIVKERGIEVPFIFVSGTMGEDRAVEAMKAGAHDYVMKENLKRLIPAIERELREAKVRKERLRAEQMLLLNEKRFRAIIDKSTDAVALANVDGTVFYSSPSTERILGYSVEERQGKSAFDIIHPDDMACVRQAFRELLESSEIREPVPFRFRHKDGSWRWGEATGIDMLAEPAVNGIVATFRDITKRKQGEKELKESESKFRAIFDNASDGMFLVDLNAQKFFMCNAMCAKMLGCTQEEFSTLDIADIHPKEDLPFISEQIGKFSRGEEGIRSDVRFKRKDGSVFTADLSPDLLTIAEKKYLLIVFKDITERKRAEEELRRSEEKYRGIFENVQDVYYESSVEGTILEVSPSIELLSGGQYQRDDLIGKSMYDFYPDPGERQAFLVALQARGRVTDFEIMMKNRDGSQIPCSISAMIRIDGQGRPEKIIGSLRNITDRKRAEKEIALLAHSLKSVAECVSITDLNDTILFVNSAFLKTYGYSEHEILGKNINVLRSPNNPPKATRDILATTLPEGWSGELLNRTKDGHDFMIALSTSSVRDEHGQVVALVGVATDITERKQAEETKRGLEAQLQQAQKLESIGTLASGIAHDFNNILGIILGYSTLLERLREDPKTHSESVAAITKATKRGASLVKQLLTFARKTEALFEIVSINDIIVEITKLLRETFPKTITISTSLQQDLPAIVSDASQIHQVLLNLCVNARDAMPKSGTLSISTRTIEGEAVSSRFAKATGYPVARQYVEIEVADTGIGMDEATRQRIFEPFFTTKPPGKGTGLGLAVVYGIIEHHTGFIDVRSAPGKGTNFTVYLPIPERALEEVQVARKSPEEIPGGTETILVIEDEEMLRELLKASLVSKGYTVLTADDGMQGVEMYRSHQKEIAVVLSDMGLPILSGQEVFRKIREINTEAKVIFASGFFDPEMKAEMYNAGLKNFIQKPYMQDEVLQKIREAIDTNG